MPKFAVRFLAFSILSVSSLALLSACTAKEDVQDPLTVDRPAEQIFKEAEAAQQEGAYRKADTLYSEVERQHPYSEFATKAQLRQAQAAYDGLKYDEAIADFGRFIELHPGHDQVPYATYMIALCYYEQMTDVSRDQGMTQRALDAFNTVINRFPDDRLARDAALKRDLVRDHLAGKEMVIGRYYMKKKQYNAAINRFLTVVKDYQTTTHVPEALLRLVEVYTILGLKTEATHTAAVLGHNYPGSVWYKDAFALLDAAQRHKLKDPRSWTRRTLDSLLSPN